MFKEFSSRSVQFIRLKRGVDFTHEILTCLDVVVVCGDGGTARLLIRLEVGAGFDEKVMRALSGPALLSGVGVSRRRINILARW